MNQDSFNFSLPKSQIDEKAKRVKSFYNLMVFNRKTQKLEDEKFENIDKFVLKKNLLTTNDTRIFLELVT